MTINHNAVRTQLVVVSRYSQNVKFYRNFIENTTKDIENGINSSLVKQMRDIEDAMKTLVEELNLLKAVKETHEIAQGKS